MSMHGVDRAMSNSLSGSAYYPDGETNDKTFQGK
jgi:hypothetical protein